MRVNADHAQRTLEQAFDVSMTQTLLGVHMKMFLDPTSKAACVVSIGYINILMKAFVVFCRLL